MLEYVEPLLERYRSRGLLIDTNLLVLLAVGSYDRSLIRRFKRTRSFDETDFDLLARFAGSFSKLVTTPHVLAEVSNLTGHLTGRHPDGVRHVMATSISSMLEQWRHAAELTADPAFFKFGLADAAIAHLVPDRYLVLTDDLPLASYLHNQGVDAINFNHIRFLR